MFRQGRFTQWMRRIALGVAMGLLTVPSGLAQDHAATAYGELLGAGFFSLNAEARFAGGDDGFGGRVGIGIVAADGAVGLMLPLEVNYLLGSASGHYLDLGVGVTFLVDLEDKGATWRDIKDHTLGHLSIGYRYQSPGSGLVLRVAFVPLFYGTDKGTEFFPYWGGLAVGYRF